MADETIRETIEETVKGPASTSVDGVSVQEQDISKQIEADRYLAGRTAAASRRTGLRIFTIKGNSPT
jgi:hypothetical protein